MYFGVCAHSPVNVRILWQYLSHCSLSVITYTSALNTDTFFCSVTHVLQLTHFDGLCCKSIKVYLPDICNIGLLHNCINLWPSFVFSRANSCNVPYHCITLALPFLFKFSTVRNHVGLIQFSPQYNPQRETTVSSSSQHLYLVSKTHIIRACIRICLLCTIICTFSGCFSNIKNGVCACVRACARAFRGFIFAP